MELEIVLLEALGIENRSHSAVSETNGATADPSQTPTHSI